MNKRAYDQGCLTALATYKVAANYANWSIAKAMRQAGLAKDEAKALRMGMGLGKNQTVGSALEAHGQDPALANWASGDHDARSLAQWHVDRLREAPQNSLLANHMVDQIAQSRAVPLHRAMSAVPVWREALHEASHGRGDHVHRDSHMDEWNAGTRPNAPQDPLLGPEAGVPVVTTGHRTRKSKGVLDLEEWRKQEVERTGPQIPKKKDQHDRD